VPRRRRPLPGGAAGPGRNGDPPPGGGWPEWAGDIRGDPGGSGTSARGDDPRDAGEPPPFRIGGTVFDPLPRPDPESLAVGDRSGAHAPEPAAGGGEPAAFRPWGPAERSRDRGGEPAVEAAARPRPFVLTAGRVAAEVPYIGLETQVTARRDSAPSPDLPPQQSAIVTLCAEPTSVAEIAALLRMHLGVTRILVADLHTAGLLDVPVSDATLATDPELIMRVMRGIRDLT
jgi:hypothetical protein